MCIRDRQTSLRGASLLPSITNYDGGTLRKGEVLGVDYVKAPRFRPKRGLDVYKRQDLGRFPGGSHGGRKGAQAQLAAGVRQARM